MKQKTRAALDAYYREGGSWAADREARLDRSQRIAWIIAAIAVAVALVVAIALVMLLPLKTVETRTLLVDRQTGFVQQLNPEKIAPDTALTQAFLVQYVIARESFDIDALQHNYRHVVLWSEGRARSRYVASVQASNPESPLASLPRSTAVETRVKSVSPLGAGSALVRFETQRRDAGGQAAPAQHWVAVIRYRYAGEPMKLEDRFINPLGFTVSHYARNAEAPPAPAPTVVTPAQASAPSPLAAPSPAPTVQVAR